MSSIDRISINRPEAERSLDELRKRDLARRYQVQLRNSSSLLLSSIEEQSQLAANRSQSSRKLGRETLLPDAATEQAADRSTVSDDFSTLASEAARAAFRASADAASTTGPRFVARKQLASTAPTASESAGTKARYPVDVNATEQMRAETARSAQREVARNDQVRPLAPESTALPDPLDQLLQEVQEAAARSEPLNVEVMNKLAALVGAAASPSAADFSVGNSPYLEGSYRFLSAFIETMESGGAEREALLSALHEARFGIKAHIAVPANVGQLVDERVTKANEQVVVDGKSSDAPASQLQDRQALYDYLEALSAAAASTTPAALHQFTAIRRHNPEAALQRLAAAGDPSVALYTEEISRRLEFLSSRVQQDSMKSIRSEKLTEAITVEKQHMQSAIEIAESMSSYGVARRKSDEREQELRSETTLPQIILQKT